MFNDSVHRFFHIFFVKFREFTQCNQVLPFMHPKAFSREIISSNSLLLRKIQHFFRQINVYTKEVTKELISRTFLSLIRVF